MLRSFFLIIGLMVTALLLINAVPHEAAVFEGVERAEYSVASSTPSEDQAVVSLVPIKTPPRRPVIQESKGIVSAVADKPAGMASSSGLVLSVPASVSSSTAYPPVPVVILAPDPSLPSLREDELFQAVVKIECPSEDRKGVYVGSGFAMPRGVVVTAAHLLTDMGGDTCKIIFPHNRAPAHYLFGTPEDHETIKKRHDEQGIDLAFLFLPALADYPEGKAVFPDGYPVVSYPVCARPNLIGDRVLHFGYPSNFTNNSYLAKNEGEAVAYGDITGVRQQLSEDQTAIYKVPVLSYTTDQSVLHPYLVSRVPSFYGDSGGLAFDATKQCILGVGHGGTIGGAAGENFSILMMLGWKGVRSILP